MVAPSLSLDGRIAIVTGAGDGLGRAEALALARAGARVVVNDVSDERAHAVADEIRTIGPESVAVAGDVAEWATGQAMLGAAVDKLGGLDVLVNNAGITRDRMIFNISEEEWDTVIRVHLRGHFVSSRLATAYWRERSKAAGGPTYGRIINTSSEAFLVGSEGQPNYAAAKAGITALTVSTARACQRYGVRANAICPRARTAMTAGVFGTEYSGEGSDPLSPDNVAPLVVYLSTPAADHINGQVFVVYGGMVSLMSPPVVEARFDAEGPAWTLEGLDGAVGAHLAGRELRAGFSCDETLRAD